MSWIQHGSSIAGLSGDRSGQSVSISDDGNIVAIGAPFHTNKDSGTVRIYEYNSGTDKWDQLGDDINGVDDYNYSGYSISLSSDGTIVAIGAYLNDDGGTYSGHVTIHEYNSGTDKWDKKKTIVGGAGGDRCGWSVSLSSDGTIVAIASNRSAGGGSTRGHVEIHKYDSSSDNWDQVLGDINGTTNADRIGDSVSLSSDGSIVAIGSINVDDGPGTNSGQVKVYEKYWE